MSLVTSVLTTAPPLATTQLLPRQDYNAQCYTDIDYAIFDTCSSAIFNDIPYCYDYDGNNACCTSWVSWEYKLYGCLASSLGTDCFSSIFSDITTVVTDYPCYTNIPFTNGQNSVIVATTPVPSLSLIDVSFTTVTTTSSHSSIPIYTGAGNLLQGYCATPDYALLGGATAYWAPMVGCAGGRIDCCPSIASTPVTAAITTTKGLPTNTGLLFTQYAQATLSSCPNDYIYVSGGCCPSGYNLWNSQLLGGQVPCYSSLATNDNPPPIPIIATGAPPPSVTRALRTTSSLSSKALHTSAVLNVVFAIRFSVQPQSNSLSTAARAGIGVGAGVAAITIVALLFFLVRSIRKNKKMKAENASRQNPPVSQVQNNAQNIPASAVPTPIGPQTQLQVQPPGQFVRTAQGNYTSPQQPQVPSYYSPESQSLQPSQNSQYQNSMQSQTYVSYPSPPPPTGSPPPQLDGRYSYQTNISNMEPQPPSGQVSSYAGSQDFSVSHQGSATSQQVSQPWGQIYQQPASMPPNFQQVAREPGQGLGQGVEQGYQMAYVDSSSPTGHWVSAGSPPELQGHQIGSSILAPAQEVQSFEQHSSQQQGHLHNVVEQVPPGSNDIDPASVPSPQQEPASISRRPVPEQRQSAHELGDTGVKE